MSKKEPAAPKAGSIATLPKMRRGLKGFYQDLIVEMRKVSWPTPKDSTRMSGMVLGVCGLVVLILFGISTGFEILWSIVMGGNG
ncbi:MAG: preprotein translocase subunit SecE [Fimbriimonadaceae bacterium]|nr:preprotein translocase subunit SecE [Fimbriimonadaceae bacterium]